MEQTLVVVDGGDRVLGYAPRSLCHTGSGRTHRAVLVLLYDGQKRLLLQKRKAELWDGCWDLAGATHPLHLATHDESYENAAQRMLMEEWGMAVPLRQLFSFQYFATIGQGCENELCMLLAGRYDGEATPNMARAYGLRWVPLTECLAELKMDPSAYTPWAQIALRALMDDPLGRELAATNHRPEY